MSYVFLIVVTSHGLYMTNLEENHQVVDNQIHDR